MPKWLKIVLGIVTVLVLICGVSAFVAMQWFENNKDRLKDLGDNAARNGGSWAMTHDANSCVEEALRQNDVENGMVAEAGHTMFMRSCLDKAKRPADFCDGVPPKSEFIATAQWTVKKCLALNRAGNQPCTRMVKAIQEVCAKSP
jgi:hypothetical protein